MLWKLDRPKMRQWGWVVLFGLACFAAGNSHETSEALAGQAQYFTKACHDEIQAHVTLQKKQDWRNWGWW